MDSKTWLKQMQYIPQVDKNNIIIGKVEKWEAHKKGILHRAITATIFYKNMVLLQHRKHVVFDGYFDLTVSSHPLYIGDKLQTEEEAVMYTLEREMGITPDMIKGEVVLRKIVYYKAQNKHEKLMEHEMDYFFDVELKHLPTFHYEYAYGYSLMPLKQVKDTHSVVYKALAPWVQRALKEGIF